MEHELENIITLSSSAESEQMAEAARAMGVNVTGQHVWDGPVPPQSFVDIAPGVRMSTAEYFFLRMANTLDTASAVLCGNEVCGYHRTRLAKHSLDSDMEFVASWPDTSTEEIERYLMPIRDTMEGRRASEVLKCVTDNTVAPSQSYAATIARLPVGEGGFGLPPAESLMMPHHTEAEWMIDWPNYEACITFSNIQGERGFRAHFNDSTIEPMEATDLDSALEAVATYMGLDFPRTVEWSRSRGALMAAHKPKAISKALDGADSRARRAKEETAGTLHRKR